MYLYGLPVLLSIFLIVAVSGCTMFVNPTSASGAGVVIEEFGPEFSNVFPFERSDLEVKLKNEGSFTATDVVVDVLGLEEWSENSRRDKCRSPFNLIAPNSQSGTQGEIVTCSIPFTAPDLTSGLAQTYIPVARVSYDYKTITRKSVSIVPRSELRRIENAGLEMPIDTISISGSPISIDIESKSPIVTFKNYVVFPILIKFNNIGGGVVCKEDCKKADDWNRLAFKIELGTRMEIDNDCNTEMETKLFKGETNAITCKIRAYDLIEGDAESTNRQEYVVKRDISVTSEYSYFIEKATSIIVK
ncbi:MAG: hypothetical protein ABIJ92_05040 [Candidatus Aenigmatarchaeota archaeon]